MDDRAAAAPAPEDRAAAAPAAAAACETDEQCRTGEICVESACRPARQRRISALFYFHQAGPRGYRMVVPFYFSLWSPRSQSRLLLPFFGDFRERERDGSERRNTFILPLLYQYHRDPAVTSHRVWPLFFYNNYGERGAGAGLIPLFYGERRGDSRLAILPPLLTFYRGDRQGSDLLLFGLAYARRRGDAQSVILPPLLSYYRDDPKEKLRDALILPALTYLRRHGDTAGGWILGLGWFYRQGQELSAGLFPLGWHKSDPKRSVTVGIPLFLDVADREKGYHHTSLLPLFHHRTEDGGKYRLLVTPLGGYSRDRTEDITTVGTVVPPLFYRDEPRRRLTVLPPLAMIYRNKETGVSSGYVGPAFWHNDDQGSTAGLAPLYLRLHNDKPAATTHVLFPLGALHHSPQRWLGFLGPLYGWSRTDAAPGGRASGGGLLPLLSFASGPRSHVAVLPPLFTWYRDRQADISQVTVGPVFARTRPGGFTAGLAPLLFLGSQRQPDGTNSSYQALLPLFFHSRDARGERLVVGPSYYLRDQPRAAGDPDAGVRAGLFPLLFFKKTPAQSYGVVFPLLWYGRAQQQQVLVAGPFFWQRRPVREPGFAPGHETSVGLFPLAYVRTSPQKSLFLSPVGGVFRDRATGSSAGVLGPYVHFERRLAADDGGGVEKMDALLPLLYAYRSPQRSAYLAFPLYTQVRDGDLHYRNLALLYHGFERPGLSAHVLFPLFLRARTAHSTLTVVGPAFYRNRDEGKAVAAGLLPLFGYGRDEKRAVLVTPLGFYSRSYKEERTRTFFGLFYGDFRPQRSDFGLFPLFFASRRDTERTVVAPLLLTYHSNDPARHRDTTIVGPFFLGHRGEGNFFGVLPFLFGGNDGKGGYRFTLAPLFHVDHRAASDGTSERTRFLSPLFGFARGPTSSWGYLGPFYLRRDADQRSEAVLPIFYHGRDLRTGNSTTLLFPLYLRTSNPDSTLTAVTPLLWQYRTLTRRVTFGFPFALDVHRPFQDRLTAVGPLVPLFVRYRDESERSTTWVFPPLLTYVKAHADGARDVVIPPLFWHFGGFDRSTTVLFPLLFHLKRPSYTATVVPPLFGHVRNDDGGTRTLIPALLTYVRRDADGGRAVTAFPLFWHRSSAERSTTVLFPLVYHLRRPELTATVIFPLGAGWKTPLGRHTLVLNTYVFRGTGLHGGEWDFRFVPLIHVGRPRRNDIEWDLLEGLVGYSRLGVNRTLRLLWGIYVPLEPVNRPTAWYGASLRMGQRTSGY